MTGRPAYLTVLPHGMDPGVRRLPQNAGMMLNCHNQPRPGRSNGRT